MLDQITTRKLVETLERLARDVEEWDRLSGGRWEYQELLEAIHRCQKMMGVEDVGAADSARKAGWTF